MNIKKYFKMSLGVAALIATQISCIQDDNWDTPEIVCNNKFDAPTMEMAAFVAMAPASGTLTIPVKDKDHPNVADVIFDGYVVSSDQSGNFYKTISFQDKTVNPTVGLQIEIDNSGNFADFPAGAHIRIKANGLVLGKDAGVLKLGAVDPNFAIGRVPRSIIGRFMSGVCNGNGLEIVEITPTVLTLDQIANDKYINTLVTVKDVQFVDSEVGKNLMDVDASGTPIDTDRHIENLAGKTAVVRTDGFFKPAVQIPNKSGDITFVVSKYNSAFQNVIRASGDINFTKERLPKPATVFEDTFSSNNYTANGWSLVSVTGAETWYIAAFGNPRPCAAMNGFNGGNKANEDWLISKSISLANAKTATFSFETDRGFAGNELEVYVTENYTGNVGTTTWVKLNPILDTTTAFSGFVNSGPINFTPYIGKNVNVAFKYTSTTSAAATWEVDNVKVIVTR